VSTAPSRGNWTELNGVSCTGIDWCVAVGQYEPNPEVLQYRTLIESWNGSKWAVMQSPNTATPSDNDSLSGVTCLSPSSCIAVGYHGAYHGSSLPSYPLIEVWNGTRWSIGPSVSPGNGNAFLSSVSCTSSEVCVATGGTNGSSGTPLMESWGGKGWTMMTPATEPNSPGVVVNGAFNGVFCESLTLCTAVGTDEGNHTLVEEWNGNAWTFVASQDASDGVGRENALSSVSCGSAGLCMAVGTGGALEHLVPLVETGSGPTPTSVTTTPRPQEVACSVSYVDQPYQGPGLFGWVVTVNNPTQFPLTKWSVSWSMPESDSFAGGSGLFVQNGDNVTASNLPPSDEIPAGGSTQFSPDFDGEPFTPVFTCTAEAA
jgi:Cellulose binding domain